MSTSDSGIIVHGFSYFGRNHFRKMKNNWSKPKRKEGEYPFLPKPPEHEVIWPVGHLETFDPETNQVKVIIDYSGTVSNSFQSSIHLTA